MSSKPCRLSFRHWFRQASSRATTTSVIRTTTRRSRSTSSVPSRMETVMRKCEICDRSAGTTHHFYDRRYLRTLGIHEKSELWRELRGPEYQHNVCGECHREMNTKQSRCQRLKCGWCKFNHICCHTSGGPLEN
jgi:hypothetical protein